MAYQTVLEFRTGARIRVAHEPIRHDLEGPDDMSAHVRSVPVGDGRLLLGTWQGIFLWEHRAAGQRRRVVVTVMG